MDLSPRQRETLARALDDATSYREPPVECPYCDEDLVLLGDDMMCDDCKGRLTQVSEYEAMRAPLGLRECRAKLRDMEVVR